MDADWFEPIPESDEWKKLARKNKKSRLSSSSSSSARKAQVQVTSPYERDDILFSDNNYMPASPLQSMHDCQRWWTSVTNTQQMSKADVLQSIIEGTEAYDIIIYKNVPPEAVSDVEKWCMEWSKRGWPWLKPAHFQYCPRESCFVVLFLATTAQRIPMDREGLKSWLRSYPTVCLSWSAELSKMLDVFMQESQHHVGVHGNLQLSAWRWMTDANASYGYRFGVQMLPRLNPRQVAPWNLSHALHVRTSKRVKEREIQLIRMWRDALSQLDVRYEEQLNMLVDILLANVKQHPAVEAFRRNSDPATHNLKHRDHQMEEWHSEVLSSAGSNVTDDSGGGSRFSSPVMMKRYNRNVREASSDNVEHIPPRTFNQHVWWTSQELDLDRCMMTAAKVQQMQKFVSGWLKNLNYPKDGIDTPWRDLLAINNKTGIGLCEHVQMVLPKEINDVVKGYRLVSFLGNGFFGMALKFARRNEKKGHVDYAVVKVGTSPDDTKTAIGAEKQAQNFAHDIEIAPPVTSVRSFVFAENTKHWFLIRMTALPLTLMDYLSLITKWFSDKDPAQLDARIDSLVDQLVNMFEEMRKNKFVHGDLWLPNMMVDMIDKNNVKLQFIDYGWCNKRYLASDARHYFYLPELDFCRLYNDLMETEKEIEWNKLKSVYAKIAKQWRQKFVNWYVDKASANSSLVQLRISTKMANWTELKAWKELWLNIQGRKNIVDSHKRSAGIQSTFPFHDILDAMYLV